MHEFMTDGMGLRLRVATIARRAMAFATGPPGGSWRSFTIPICRREAGDLVPAPCITLPFTWTIRRRRRVSRRTWKVSATRTARNRRIEAT